MKARGFTLIEMLVVISIISLLSSILLVGNKTASIKVRDTRRLADIRQISTALELYHNKYGVYPISEDDWPPRGFDFTEGTYMSGYDNKFLSPLVSEGLIPPFINDPGNNYYLYIWRKVGVPNNDAAFNGYCGSNTKAKALLSFQLEQGPSGSYINYGGLNIICFYE